MDLRAVTMDDAKLLFDWINDPDDRANSLSQEPVQWDGHLNWLKARLSRESPHLYIAVVDGVPVGTLRIDGDQVSCSIAPTERKKGHASVLLDIAERRFGPLKADIMASNVASIRACEKAGIAYTII